MNKFNYVEVSMNEEKLVKGISDYLENLRREGTLNMLEAGPYVAAVFALSEKEAKERLYDWFNSFDE